MDTLASVIYFPKSFESFCFRKAARICAKAVIVCGACTSLRSKLWFRTLNVEIVQTEVCHRSTQFTELKFDTSHSVFCSRYQWMQTYRPIMRGSLLCLGGMRRRWAETLRASCCATTLLACSSRPIHQVGSNKAANSHRNYSRSCRSPSLDAIV